MAYAAQGGRGRKAVAAVQTAVRCGVYCRKSTTEGQDSTFNSLDNQQQAAESYIASQRHTGWTTLPERYHDFGFSGGNVDRPALQRLLADAKNGVVDTIVVYRLDRLSRSLIDFLQIHESLERWGVGLVSVTENINTTTPHGRMMVNVLLSFAQYERELIGERTRDKLHAARRLGRWTGGMPPLGYDVVAEGGKLVVNKDEAEQVRAIFGLYAEMRSFIGVAQELNRRGWRRKSWTTKDGKRREGKPWDKENLRHILGNPLYAGMQKLGHETFRGEHQGVVPVGLFRQVQGILRENQRPGGGGRPNLHGALLRGLLHCASCDRAMAHQWTRSHNRLYRYYVCQRAMKEGWSSCPTKSVPAEHVENFVVDQIKKIGSDPALREETFRQVQVQVAAERRGLKAEAKRIEREVTTARTDVGRLTNTLTLANGLAADALMAKLSESQERLTTLESRKHEIEQRVAALKAQDVDPVAVGQALVQFTEIWDVLLAPERERIVRLLIEQVQYDGATGTLQLAFSPAGFSLLAADLAKAEPMP